MWEEVRRGRREDVGARARAERTENMTPMFVTLAVSKLSSWLNADANCRVERRACGTGRRAARGRREGFGWRRRKWHEWGGPTQGCGGQGTRSARRTCCSCTGRDRLKKGCGARARAERTWNIRSMFVTLEVSKLSGWLNTDARCRVERQACDVGRGAAREA